MRRLLRNRVPRRAASALLLALALSLPAFGSAAHADGVVVVPGTAFPDSDTYLAHFGCDSLFHVDASRPAVEVVLDDGAPLGRRALALRNDDVGGATGPVSRVDSVATSRQGLSVRAPEGSTGVAWVWYATAMLEPGEVWVGRADIAAPAGGWRDLEPGDSTYTWTRVDSATGAVLEDAGEATPPEFTALHGDGPGYLLSGLGCDGNQQVLDDVRVGVPGATTTYDLEGTDVTTTISVPTTEVPEGESLTVTGTTLDSRGVVGAALVLQARRAGEAHFRDVGDPVTPGPGGAVTVEVSPRVDTDYRWWFAERPYADAHASPEVTVRVRAAVPADAPTSATDPTSPPSTPVEPTAPAASPSASPSPTPSKTAPSPSATSPSPSGSPTPDDAPTDSAESPTGDPTTAAPSATPDSTP